MAETRMKSVRMTRRSGFVASMAAGTAILALALGACGDGAAGKAEPASPGPGKPATPEPQPADGKPADAKAPATKPADGEAPAGFAKVKIGGKAYTLELALTMARRFRGLSERGKIPDATGMLFVFPDNQVTVQNFVMRDCPEPIDIIYLDGKGRILAMYEMKAEPPRTGEEKENSVQFGAPAWSATNSQYEMRLKQYSSRFPSQFVIEIAGGAMKALPTPLKVGDVIEIDIEGLKKLAK